MTRTESPALRKSEKKWREENRDRLLDEIIDANIGYLKSILGKSGADDDEDLRDRLRKEVTIRLKAS